MHEDKLLSSILHKQKTKYEKGVKQYGNKGLMDSNLDVIDLLENMQEESLDSVAYSEALILTVKRSVDILKIGLDANGVEEKQYAIKRALDVLAKSKL